MLRYTLSMKYLKLFLFLLILFIFLFPTASYAIGPFGGMIGFIFPFCVEGWLLTLGPPTPGTYMYTWGTRSYLNGPPTHPGQWLLGMAGPPITCHVPCKAGLCPVGVGSAIIFHGSSF